MATQETTNENVAPMDSAMEKFLEFLPESEKSGESPDNTGDGNEPVKPDASAQAEGGTDDKSVNTDDTPPADPKDDNNGEAPADTPSFDLAKYFEESSGGLLKSEEDFKGAISKIKEFDDLQKQVEILKAEKENIFANDFVKTLNNLHREGKSQEQIDSFIALSKVDLSKISGKEALIQDQILNHGHTRVIAERIVSRKYGLDKLSFDEEFLTAEEIQANRDEEETILSIMENDAKPVVEGLKKSLSDIQNSVSPEQKALEEAARKKAYEKALEPFADQLANDLPKKIELPLEGDLKLTYDLPEDFLASAKQEAIEYFNHPDMEVNSESVGDFVTMKKALYVYSKLKDIMTHSYEQGKAVGTKQAISEFENSGGVVKPDSNTETTVENIDEQLMAIARG